MKDLDKQTADPFCKPSEHYWASNHVPKFDLWVRQCMTCGMFDGEYMQKDLETNYLSKAQIKQALPKESDVIAYYGKDYSEWNRGYNQALAAVRKRLGVDDG